MWLIPNRWALVTLMCVVLWPVGAATQGAPHIRHLQARLAAEGFDPGTLDGILGRRTRSALRRYQDVLGLKVTGHLDAATRQELGPCCRPGEPTAMANAFVIPLEAGVPDQPTRTRVEVHPVTDRPDRALFSVSCAGCWLEAQRVGPGFRALIWTAGAEHTYKGVAVVSTQLSPVNLPESGAGLENFTRAGGATLLYANCVRGWSFESDPTAPLTFKVVAKRGYVHIEGKGVVRSPEGQVYHLGK